MKHLRRRHLLRGLGGTALTLPLMDITRSQEASAGGAQAPLRYCLLFGGLSLGSDGDGQQQVIPVTEGANFEQTRGLRALWGGGEVPTLPYDYPDVRDDVALASGLFMPVADAPGGRDGAFHAASFCPLLCGQRNYQQSGDSGFMSADMRGPTSDWIAHQTLSEGRPLLTYRAQYGDPAGFVDGAMGRISAGEGGAPNHPISRPEIAFDDVFSGIDGNDPEALAAWERAKLERGTVLDLVWERGHSLMQRVGADDRIRLERHFDEVRALETRIQDLAPPNAGCAPERPSDPEGGTEAAWSNEDVRAALFVDLIHTAFACDVARVATLQLTLGSCYLSAEHMTQSGTNLDVHTCSHGGGGNQGSTNLADIYAWHLAHFAELVDRLRNTPDTNGSLLDNTAMVFVTEGGFGGPGQSASSQSHSTANMLSVHAGRMGGLSKGEHVDFGNDVHAAQSLTTALDAVGAGDSLGEISGTLG